MYNLSDMYYHLIQLLTKPSETQMTNIKSHSPAYRRARETLSSSPLMRGVAATGLEELMADASLCRLGDGERVFSQGEAADYWYLVMTGRVDTLREGYDGECRVVQLVEPGQLLAPIVMFMPGLEYPVSARASGSTLLCRFRRQQLHALCRSEPELALRVLEIAGQALCKRIDDVENLSSRNGPQRLAAYLYQLYLEQGKAITLPLSHRELAAKLGLRPETLSRLLGNLRRQGVLQGQRLHWTITDRERLRGMQLPTAD